MFIVKRNINLYSVSTQKALGMQKGSYMIWGAQAVQTS